MIHFAEDHYRNYHKWRSLRELMAMLKVAKP
jgi:hypothetical protein